MKKASILLLTGLVACCVQVSISFSATTLHSRPSTTTSWTTTTTRIFASPPVLANKEPPLIISRRHALLSPLLVLSSLSSFSVLPALAATADATSTSLSDLMSTLQQARRQLDPVPSLIDQRKWDSVRAILIQPPLSDCWNKSASLTKKYASVLGDMPSGDELAALEAREDAVSHLRFLDMAV